MTVVIIRQDMLDRSAARREKLPNYLSYANHAENDSMLNTPPSYNWYLAGLGALTPAIALALVVAGALLGTPGLPKLDVLSVKQEAEPTPAPTLPPVPVQPPAPNLGPCSTVPTTAQACCPYHTP